MSDLFWLSDAQMAEGADHLQRIDRLIGLRKGIAASCQIGNGASALIQAISPSFGFRLIDVYRL